MSSWLGAQISPLFDSTAQYQQKNDKLWSTNSIIPLRRNPFLFLLSAKAGGVGLNLIGASRLVLFDVDWNPATDDQAVARIHRQGQKRHCKIYRFLVQGGLEERIWQRQVVKRALAESIMQGGASATLSSLETGGKGKGTTSTFSQDELKNLFRLDESDVLRTHELIECRCEGAGMEAGEKDDGDASLNELNAKDREDETSSSTSNNQSPSKSPGASWSPGSSWSTAKEALHSPPSPPKTGHEAEKHELMKYRHINTSLLHRHRGRGR